MNRKDQVINFARHNKIIRPRDIENLGIPREYLLRLFRKGELERIGRGLYTLPGLETTEQVSFTEIAKLVPNAVICLISALNFHDLTTQLPFEIWIAIERGRWKPDITYPPINVTHISGESFSHSVETHVISGVPVKIYNPAKTIADCFKFRSKVGLDVAVEALRQGWREKKFTMDELWTASKINRISNVIRPYMAAVT